MTTCPVAHDFNPLNPSTVLNPYPDFERLRHEGPVFYMPELDHYIVTRFEDVEKILLDRETWSASIASNPLKPPCAGAQEVLASGGYRRVPTLNNADAPRHAPMRRSVLSVLSPRRMKALEPHLREVARALIKGFQNEEEIDFVERLSFPFPGYAAFSLLGFPEEDTDLLKDWSANRILFTYGNLSDEQQIQIAEEIVLFWQYCEKFVAKRSADPQDDVTSDLILLSREKPEQLNEFDIVNMVYSMALAGHETTCNTIGNGVRALLENRSQFEELIADPSKIPNAVEEILRYDGPVLNHRRLAKVDTQIGGVDIPAGAKVMMCFGSAGHDDAQFENSEVFDIDRDDADLHMAFGKGPHLCLGAPLARLEVRIVLELLTEMTPNMTIVEGQTFDYSPNALFRGLRGMLVRPGGNA